MQIAVASIKIPNQTSSFIPHMHILGMMFEALW